jgi:hypothetical protein
MSTDRHLSSTPRYLTGVIDVDGALYRIPRVPVTMTRHPSGRTILTVESSTIRRIGDTPSE